MLPVRTRHVLPPQESDVSHQLHNSSDAVTRIVPGECADMTVSDRRHLALALAGCHLLHAGRTPPVTSSGVSCADLKGAIDVDAVASECAASLDDAGFSAYTTLYVHVDALCFFLGTAAWRARTDAVVNRLSSASAEAAARLSASFRAQEELLTNQQESLANEAALLSLERQLSEALGAARDDVGAYHAAVSDAVAALAAGVEAEAERLTPLIQDIRQTTELLVWLHAQATGDLASAKVAVVYCGAAASAWFVTAWRRAAAARPALLGLLATAFVLEVWLSRRWAAQLAGVNGSEDAQSAHDGLHTVRALQTGTRWAVFAAAAAVWARAVWRFVDLAEENNALLQRVAGTVADMTRAVQGLLTVQTPEIEVDDARSGLCELAKPTWDGEDSDDADYVPLDGSDSFSCSSASGSATMDDVSESEVNDLADMSLPCGAAHGVVAYNTSDGRRSPRIACRAAQPE